MDLTAYRAIEANRWRSRFVAAVNGAVIACLFAFAVWIFGPIYLIAEAWISRQREYLADAQAVLVTRHPEGLISALRRLSSVDPLAESVAPRARSFNEDGERLAASLWIVSPNALAGGWVSRLLDAHPSTQDRIRRLERMS